MNILLFSRIIAKTGVGNHMNELAHELDRQGHNVIVVSGTNELGIQGIPVYQIPLPTLNPVTLFKDINAIHKLVKENNIDVVHCHHRMAALVMKFYNIFFKIPVVYTLHLAGIPHDFFHRVMTYAGDQAIGVSTEVSRFMVKDLKIPKEKVTTVLNGVNPDLLKPLTQEEKREVMLRIGEKTDEKFVIALHSRIDEVKNHMLVVEAIHQLPEEVRRKIVVVCSGTPVGSYYEKCIQKISEYKLEDIFRFIGWTQTRDILGIADMLCLPSRNEGFPLSVCEAFLMKVPVVRTRTAGFDDVCYCIPIDMDDPEPLIEIIVESVNGNINKLRENVYISYQFANKTLTVEQMTLNTLNVYKKAIDNK